MNSLLPSVRSLTEMFVGKTQEFVSEIENVHMVWLEEIQQEANRMFSRDFNAEPELMPKTPSQKKNSRRKRVSAGRQEEGQSRRFSKGKRSNLRGSSVKALNLIPEEAAISEVSPSKASNPPKPKRATRKNKRTKPGDADESLSSSDGSNQEEVQNKKPELVKEEDDVDKVQKGNDTEIKSDDGSSVSRSPPKSLSPELVVCISAEDRLSAELAGKPEASPGRTATKIAIAAADRRSKRSSARCTLKLRHSVAGLRHSMTQESVRRASRRSMLKRKSTQMSTFTSSSSNTGGVNVSMDTAEEDNEEVKTEAETEDTVDDLLEEASESPEPERSRDVSMPAVERVTRSVAANSPKLAPPPLFCSLGKMSTPAKKSVTAARKHSQATRSSRLSSKRKAPDTEESPSKRCSPPKKSQTTIKPYMRSFLHTVNKNQMLMMTPGSTGRAAVIKSFIKQNTPLKVDPKINMGIVTKERYKLEALRKKQEQEEERMRKMEEEKKRKQEEQKRKREERIKRVFEAKVKEELREEEKKKKIEQKMAQIDEKNDKRQAEEKAKKKLAAKRQEELEQKKKLEEEARKRKIQQEEEEKRQQELAAKRKAEEEEQQARKARERQREQELELERERQAAAAAAERERVEKEKALALQREVERAAREKEKRELEERRKALEDKRKLEEQQRLAAKEKALKEREEAKRREAAAAEAQKLVNKTIDLEYSVMKTPVGKAGLNVTVDIPEMSPQSYTITPKGGDKKPNISKNPQNYGMDQNSDDSTDDESAPRKPIPAWASGANLEQLIMKQYFKPIDVDSIFQPIEPLKLENIFYKSKPRYFKRTSSAVWHSPPAGEK